MVVLRVFRDSERDAGGWVVQKWQCQRDVIIEQPLSVVGLRKVSASECSVPISKANIIKSRKIKTIQ